MNDKQRSSGRVRKQKLHKVKLLYVQRGRQVRNIQTLPILAIEVDCKRKKSDHRRCARHNGRVRENPGRQQPCWGSLFCTNLTQPTGALDQRTGEEVFEILKKINEQGKTIIIVTHDMKIAEKTNRIITIVDGKILSDSKNNNFFLSPVDNINNELSDSEKKYLKNKVRILLSIEVVIFVMLLINGAEYWSEIIAVAIMIVAGLVLIGFIKNRIRG